MFCHLFLLYLRLKHTNLYAPCVYIRAPLPVGLEQDYQHLYYGGLSSTLLAPPAGEEVLLEVRGGEVAVVKACFVSNDLSVVPPPPPEH